MCLALSFVPFVCLWMVFFFKLSIVVVSAKFTGCINSIFSRYCTCLDRRWGIMMQTSYRLEFILIKIYFILELGHNNTNTVYESD